jgi:hypothetical protein
MMDKTGMFASTGREMELLAWHLLGDMWFLDGSEDAWEQERSRLLSDHGKLGVAGPFEALFGSPSRPAEVASVFAEVFCRFGYLTVDNLVTPQRWQEMTGSLRERFENRDVRCSEAERILGRPSLVVRIPGTRRAVCGS